MKTAFNLDENAILNMCYLALPNQSQHQMLDQLRTYFDLADLQTKPTIAKVADKIKALPANEYQELLAKMPFPELEIDLEDFEGNEQD